MKPLLLLLLSCGFVAAETWRPVTAPELAQKTARVEPGADAEAIFWDVKVEDQLTGGGDLQMTLSHYIRIKIFTEHGKEKYAKVEIEQFGKRRITDIAGRTIKPDGTIIDLKKDGIFDRELVRSKGLKVHGKTFTLPNVEVGDIIEYRYREHRENEVADFMRLYFQRDLPLWDVTYHLKPLNIPWAPFGMRTITFGFTSKAFRKEPEGYFATSMSDMPAFREEPYMPPEDQSRAWMLIYYEEDKKYDPEKYWKEIGKSDYSSLKKYISPDGLVKRTAAELVTGIDKPEDKLAALDRFCRTKIENISNSTSQLTADQRKAVKENNSAGDILKQKAGRGMDIDFLFAALASAAGFDARMARIPDRGDTFFDTRRTTTYFIRNFSVGVKVDDSWKFFDPASPHLEPGMLRWQEEGQPALVSDPKEGFWTKTQHLEPAKSLRQHRAMFKLQDDGTIEGAVEYVYTGHVAREQRLQFEKMSPAEQEEDWKKALQSRLSTAEISAFEMKNLTDSMQTMQVKHKVSVPGYATRTGKRILLQPAYFQRNMGPRFTESTRKWDLYFDYGWSEDDEVTFELPEGWEFDQPVAPQSSQIQDVGQYTVKVLKTTDGRRLIYQRKFDWGRNMNILMQAKSYQVIKKIFDFVQEQDGYTISLKSAANVP
jgi:hypothetical protein